MNSKINGYIQKLIGLAVVIVLILAVTGCDSNDGTELNGEYKANEFVSENGDENEYLGYTIEFKDDGTYQMYMNGTYSLFDKNGKKGITLQPDGGYSAVDYVIEKTDKKYQIKVSSWMKDMPNTTEYLQEATLIFDSGTNGLDGQDLFKGQYKPGNKSGSSYYFFDDGTYKVDAGSGVFELKDDKLYMGDTTDEMDEYDVSKNDDGIVIKSVEDNSTEDNFVLIKLD